MFTRILVATDFSAPSDAALVYAKAVATQFSASLHLLHVVENPVVAGMLGAEVLVPDTSAMVAASGSRSRPASFTKRSDRFHVV